MNVSLFYFAHTHNIVLSRMLVQYSRLLASVLKSIERNLRGCETFISLFLKHLLWIFVKLNFVIPLKKIFNPFKVNCENKKCYSIEWMSEWEGEQNNGKQTVLYGSLILTAKDFLSLFSPFFSAFCSLCCSHRLALLWISWYCCCL